MSAAGFYNYPIATPVPCACGSTDAYWHGDAAVPPGRQHACDTCWARSHGDTSAHRCRRCGFGVPCDCGTADACSLCSFCRSAEPMVGESARVARWRGGAADRAVAVPAGRHER